MEYSKPSVMNDRRGEHNGHQKTQERHHRHLATGFSITLAACYGPSDPDYSPSGQVRDAQTMEGIPGIEVCAVQQTYSYCETTDTYGNYSLNVSPDIHYDDYQICVEDIDGTENGSYQSQCATVEAHTEFPYVSFDLTSEK